MEYVLGLVLVALVIELLAWQKVWGTAPVPTAPEMAPQPGEQPAFRVYTTAEIRVMEKEAAYEAELRAVRRGLSIPERETTFRGMPYVKNS